MYSASHGIICLAFCIAVVGCTKQRGRWDHYTNGGSFKGAGISMSPEGRVVVYASPRSGKGDIYRVNRDGTGRTRLTATPTYEGDPVFSPDGSTIAFVREQDGIGEIWIMNGDGSRQRRLTHSPGYDCLPSFSPDGSQIVFTRYVRDSKFRPGTAASTEIFIMNTDGTDETRLTDNQQADWAGRFSPDGERILYTVSVPEEKTPAEEVWMMHRDGSRKRRLSTGSTPAFSPDGSKIVFLSGQYAREISMMDADGSNVRQLYVSKTYKSNPQFCSDGRSILFLDEPTARGFGEICIVSLDGSEFESIERTD